MKSDWDFYLCEVEKRPASILVDMGAVEHAPDERYPRMGYVSVSFDSADENGFPSGEDHEALARLEDALVEALTPGGNCLYVGRCILDGRMDCIFYLSPAFAWEEAVNEVLGDFPVFEWEVGAHAEADWSTYLEFLFPDPVNLVEIQNRRALRRLEERGDELEVARAVEHWLSFASMEAAEDFWDEAEELGFLRQAGKEAGADGVCRICLRRNDAPVNLDSVALDLLALALKHEGFYDGWGCVGLEKEEE